jgi:hypothetical protein
MKATGIKGAANGPEDGRLIAVLEECLAGLEQGLAPDREALRARYPDLAGDLLACLDGLNSFIARRRDRDFQQAMYWPFRLRREESVITV